jgi:hypothetical protein
MTADDADGEVDEGGDGEAGGEVAEGAIGAIVDNAMTGVQTAEGGELDEQDDFDLDFDALKEEEEGGGEEGAEDQEDGALQAGDMPVDGGVSEEAVGPL